MPSYWYSYRDCLPEENDDPETLATKEFNRKIVAAEKPYFMKYVYPQLKTKHNQYEKENKYKAGRMFFDYGISSISDLEAYPEKTQAMIDFLDNYYDHMPVGNNPCVINRICWLAEKEFSTFKSSSLGSAEFDYSILKCGYPYTKYMYDKIASLYNDYKDKLRMYKNHRNALSESSKSDDELYSNWYDSITSSFQREAIMTCSNENELCDILIDLSYGNEEGKMFVWTTVGQVILDNLLARNNREYNYPARVDNDGEFRFAGMDFVMRKVRIENENDCSE